MRGAGSVVPTLVAAAAVGRASARCEEADADAGKAHAQSAPIGGAPPSDTESDKSGRTHASEELVADTCRGAIP